MLKDVKVMFFSLITIFPIMIFEVIVSQQQNLEVSFHPQVCFNEHVANVNYILTGKLSAFVCI
jgi:hypothetical protein